MNRVKGGGSNPSYVLVFDKPGTSGETYTMGTGQTVALSTIVGAYNPKPSYDKHEWDFNGASSSDTNKIEVSGGVAKLATNPPAIANGEKVYINVPYEYWNIGDTYRTRENLQLTVTVIDANSKGEVTPPTAKEGLVYNGAAQLLFNSGSSTFGKMSYNVDGSAWKAYNESEDAFKKTEAGTYTVNWKLEGDDGNVIKSSHIDVTIDPAEITAEPKAKEDLVYTGSDQQLLESAGETNVNDGHFEYCVSDSSMTAPTTGWSSDLSTVKAKKAGAHYVWYRVVNNATDQKVLAGPDYVTAVIDPAGAEDFVPPEYADGLVYNGKAQNLIAKPGSVANAKILYAVTDNFNEPATTAWKEDYNDESLKKKNAGKYVVWYKVVMTTGSGQETNEEELIAPVSEAVTIEQAELDPDFEITKKTLIYNDGQALVTVTGLPDEDGLKTEYSVDNGNYSTAIPENTDLSVGEHSIKWRVVDENNNYKPYSGGDTVTVGKAKVVVTVPVGKTVTYNGEEQSLVGAGVIEDDKYAFQYRIQGEDSQWSEKAERTNAGDYTVEYKVVAKTTEGYGAFDDANCELVDENGEPVAKSGSFDSFIDPATVSLKWTNMGQYIISAATPGPLGPTVEIEGVCEDDEVAPVFDPDYDLNLQSQPGSYTTKVSGLNNDNYILSTDAVTTQDFRLVNMLEETAVFAKDMTYGDEGTTVNATQNGNVIDETKYNVTYYYKLDDESVTKWEDWGPDSTTPAGNYLVKAQITDPEGEVLFAQPEPSKFTIEKKAVTVKADDYWLSYGETVDPTTDFTCEVDGLTPADEAKASKIFKVSYSVEGSQPYPVGTYDINPTTTQVNAAAYANYEFEYVSGNLYVNDAMENEIELTVQDYTYGDTIVKPTATATYGEPEIKWIAKEDYNNSTEDQWNEWGNTNDQKPKNAGTYIVRAKVEGTKDYPPAEVMKEFTIAKKPATIQIENGSAVYTGGEFDVNEIAKATVTGETDEDKDKIEYTVSAKPSPVKKVGTYTLTAKVADNDVSRNYEVTVKDGVYDITEADVMTAQVEYVNTDSATSGECTFDGTTHGIKVTPIVNGEQLSPSEAEVYYKLEKFDEKTSFNDPDDGGVNNPELASADHAGKYVIWYYIKAKDYDDVKGSAVLNVHQAYLRVKAIDKEIVYGTPIEYQNWNDAEDKGFVSFKAYKDKAETEEIEFTAEEKYVQGLSDFELTMKKQNGDAYIGELSDVGSYTVKPSKLTSNDYIINYTNAMLAIEPKPVTFSWSHKDNYEFTYNGSEQGIEAYVNKDDLVTTDKQDGKVEIVYEDNNKYPNKAVNVLREEGEDGDWSVGTYTAKVQSLKGERAHNYKINWEDENATFESHYKIVPVNMYLTPNDVTIFYGDKAVDKGFTAKGLVNAEKAENVLLGLPAEYAFGGYKRGSDVGNYDITITNVADPNTTKGLHAQNYNVKALPNVEGLTVNQRPITLKWSQLNKFEYDGQYHEVAVASAENDYAGNSAIDPKPVYTDAKKVNAGSYTAIAKLSDKDARNYKILNNSDHYNWQITKRPVTIYAKGNKIDYGQAPDDKGYYIDKKPLVKNAENNNQLDKIGKVTFKYNYSKNGKPGNYKITPVVTNLNPNYYLAKTVKGTLVVNYKQKVLLVQGKASGSKGARLAWNSVSGAKKYVVYFSKCDKGNKKYKPKKVATVKGRTYRVGKLKKNSCYKYYVVAKDKKGKKIAKSLVSHVITGNTDGKYTNAKSLKVNKKKVTISRGGTFKIKVKQKKARKHRTLLDQGHVALLRYTSAKKAVATVSGTGVITGVSKGWCKVYVSTANGIWQEIQVKVK